MDDERTLCLLIKADRTRTFVSLTNEHAELGHPCGRYTTDGYIIYHQSNLCLCTTDLRAILLDERFLRPAILDTCARSEMIFPGSLLIRKEDNTNMTQEDFNRMLAIRTPVKVNKCDLINSMCIIL